MMSSRKIMLLILCLVSVGVLCGINIFYEQKTSEEKFPVTIYDQESPDEVFLYIIQGNEILEINRKEIEFNTSKGHMKMASNVDGNEWRELLAHLVVHEKEALYLPGGPHHILTIYSENMKIEYSSDDPANEKGISKILEYIRSNKFTSIETMPLLGNKEIKKMADWFFSGAR